MSDVARTAGVSLMTVSNVINSRFDEMSPQTRERVEKTIRTLNYKPHSTARNLRLAERLTIGLLFVDSDPMYLAHPGHAYVVAGLSSYLNEHGYSLTTQGVHPDQVGNALALNKIEADALCVIHCGQRTRRVDTMEKLLKVPYPCVLIHERRLPLPDVCCIRADDYRGGYLLANHLIERGCRDLLMVQPDVIWASMEERVRGISAACRKARIKHSMIRCGSAHLEAAHDALSDYLRTSPLPDGILACHDQMGISILRFLKERSVAVPKRVRVTGFNAFELWKYSDPLLTTVRAPADELGRAAGEELIARLTTGSFRSPSITLPVEFVAGTSS
jgi:DNA-binding LacI/PurR family transcriptional regulator